MDQAELVSRLRPVLFRVAGNSFEAAYCEDWSTVRSVLERHPTLHMYTVSSWNEETWVHRGLRNVNRMGFLLATNADLESSELNLTQGRPSSSDAN
jgi:hypothetical protein